MAKLNLKYATMNSGKSIDLMRTAYNYEENGYRVLVLKPKCDTKGGEYIDSRVGLRRKADILIDDYFVFIKVLLFLLVIYVPASALCCARRGVLL